MNDLEQQGVIAICIFAALADGSQSDSERTQVQKITAGFHQNPTLGTIYQQIQGQKLTLPQASQNVASPEGRTLAYEMAVCVCNADNVTSPDEQRFLQELRSLLQLDDTASAQIKTKVEQVAQTPPVQLPGRLSVAAENDIDQMILNCAVLTAALELLPPSIATMSIVPIQIRMVYRIGQNHGFELSRHHIQDFLATVGVGLTSQVVEGFARKLVGNLTRSLGGKFMAGVAETATGSAMAFGTTYALGQIGKQYYASGRTLDANQLQNIFAKLLTEGKALQSKYATQIFEKSRQIEAGNLLPALSGH